VPRAANGKTLFEAMASHGHAVYGSSSLIDLQSMMQVSRALEDMAARGHEALKQLEANVAQVRAVAALCHDSAEALGKMLALELRGQSEEALALAGALLPRIAEAVAPLPPAPDEPGAPAPPSSRQFLFADADDDETRGPASVVAVQDELQAVFQEEAREFLVVLKRHFKTLSSHPNDLGTAGLIERVFHTLKGAAATVGLTEVTALASTLQGRFEEIVDGGAQVTPPFLGEVFRLTNRLLRVSQLPEITLDLLKPDENTVQGDRTRAYFLEEAQGIAAESSALVDALAKAGAERRGPLIKQLSRLFHGLKGSALVLGDQQVAEVAVSLQEASGSGAIAALRADLARLHALIESDVEASSVLESGVQAAALWPTRNSEKVSAGEDPELWGAFLQECQELIEAIDQEIFALEPSPQPKTNLQALLRHVHTLKGAVSSVGLAPTGQMLHAVEDFLERLVDATILPSMKNVATFLLAVQAEVRLNLKQAPAGAVDSSHATIVGWASRVMAGGLERQAAPSSRALEGSGSAGSGAASTGRADLDELGDRRFIRVPAERLDELMNLAGELVVNRSRLLNRVDTLKSLQHGLGDTRRSLFSRVDEFRRQNEFSNLGGARVARGSAASAPARAPTRKGAFGAFTDLELDRYDDVHILARSLAEIADDLTEMDGQVSRELNHITEESDTFSFVVSRIQSEVTRTRMISVESLFARLRLPIREAAGQQSKDVDVKLTEEEVSLDKTIIDALYKPMLHLVRNAVYHGLESAAERKALGKPANGQLSLRARQEAGQIVLEIADDGRGLDLQALKERGVAAGLLGPEVPLDDPAVKNLVFAPRISTASSVSSVAGRGVGGDVVKRAVERLNGDIRVESRPGVGTVFSVTLPMTLLITPALLLRSGGQNFALPLFFAERIVEVEDRAMVDVLGSAQLKVGDRFLPVRRLEQVFGEPVVPRLGPVIVLRIGERRLALQVDAVLVREEVVVKHLGRPIGGHALFAGVTMRGNGDLMLILDVPGLMDHENVGHALERPALAAQPTGVESSVQLTPQPSAPLTSAAAEPKVAVARTTSRILFVDDSLSVRKVAERTLLELGVEVTLAVDGIDAMEKLRLSEHDLVFTDLEMPRMHGYELISEVRQHPRFKDLPVVVVSSRSGTKHQDQARSLGATDYLTKPFTQQVLRAVLSRLLKNWKG
jgi:chemosensory pili system protein ChpA (sensor histidine kinase/response regulator)